MCELGSVTIIHFGFCTVQNYWHIVDESWERGLRILQNT